MSSASNQQRTHRIQIGGITRNLPLMTMPSGATVAIFDLIDDPMLTEEAGMELAKKIQGLGRAYQPDALLVPDGKSLALAHVVAREMGIPRFTARKSIKPYMIEPVTETIDATMTTGKPQSFSISGLDAFRLQGMEVLIIDDVISTGATQEVLRRLMTKVGATVTGMAAVFTEGDTRPGVISLGHLPIFS